MDYEVETTEKTRGKCSRAVSKLFEGRSSLDLDLIFLASEGLLKLEIYVFVRLAQHTRALPPSCAEHEIYQGFEIFPVKFLDGGCSRADQRSCCLNQ